MEVLIDKLEFAQEPHTNGLITWDISGKRYKKGYFLTEIIKKIW